jgi:hypothetical protein
MALSPRDEIEKRALIEALYRTPALQELLRQDNDLDLITPSVEEMREFFTALSYAAFINLMKMQNKSLRAIEAAMADLNKIDCPQFSYAMKDKLKRLMNQRERNSEVAYNFFESSEGLPIVATLLNKINKDQLQNMLDIIEEQESIYNLMAIKTTRYIDLLYKSWKREIQKELSSRN